MKETKKSRESGQGKSAGEGAREEPPAAMKAHGEEHPGGALWLVSFDEDIPIEEAVARACAGAPALQKLSGEPTAIEEILAVFGDLRGAEYHPRTRCCDYYEHAPEAPKPGRVSPYYDAVFMREQAILSYIAQCRRQESTALVLAEAGTMEVRRQRTDRGQSAPELPGIRHILEEIAGDEKMRFFSSPLSAIQGGR